MQTRIVLSRRGFTLVEMLVVIAIIGILVALLIPAVSRVTWSVRNSANATEIQDLSRAIEAYKTFANDYPPDFTNTAALVNHVAKAYPRNGRVIWVTGPSGWFTPNPPTWSTNSSSGLDARDPPYLDPAEALVFWLSMLSTNPRDPLGGADASYTGERKVFFDFKKERLVDLDNDGWQEYLPKYGAEQPYVYFDGRVVGGMYAYGTAVYATPQPTLATPTQPTVVSPAPTQGVVRPYRSNTLVDNRDNSRTQPYQTPTASENTMQWINPGTFQILCAGQDSDWGVDYVSGTTVIFKTFPEVNYSITGPDEDNMGNFGDMKTMGDAVP